MAYKNKEDLIYYCKQYRQRPKVKERARLRRQTKAYKEWQRIYNLTKRKRNCGITAKLFQETLLLQKGECAICFQKMKKPQADHCHKTRVFRGLLCIRCNLGLSFLENKSYTINAFAYLGGSNELQKLS